MIFGVVFLAQLGAMCGVAAVYGVQAIDKLQEYINKASDTSSSTTTTGSIDEYDDLGKVATVVGVVALLASGLMVMVMMKLASILVKLSLLFSVVSGLAVSALGFAVGNLIVGIIGLVSFALSVCYAFCVWSRIPFATANLVTGSSAVLSNIGVTFSGYFFSLAGIAWSVVWTMVLAGVYFKSPQLDANCVSDADTLCARQINYGYMFLLFLSLYWTQQVFQNVVHVSVAGTVGTWWFVPEEANSCCSSAVTSSVCRSCTYSFGSICMGSFLVALIKALRALAQQARNNDDANAILVCVVDCILSCIEGIIEYFNKWAFVYIGVYGYGYMEAGKNVITLFKDRGWEIIIADNLVDNTLSLVSLLFAALMGCFGLVLESTTPWFEGFEEKLAKPIAFLFAFVVGAVVCNIVLSVVSSAVDTAIVLFAEAPAEFESNHPKLSAKMRAAYMAIYPELL